MDEASDVVDGVAGDGDAKQVARRLMVSDGLAGGGVRATVRGS